VVRHGDKTFAQNMKNSTALTLPRKSSQDNPKSGISIVIAMALFRLVV